ncbi:MAG: hypothetical protein V4547_17975 [Bacteroidota bacterium]
MSRATILFKLATRGRAAQFKQCILNVFNNISEEGKYIILVSADIDDDTMYNDDIHKFCLNKNIQIKFTKNKTKIEAINNDIKLIQGWDILVNLSDDQRFTKHEFDEIIRNDFKMLCPDFDGLLYYPDKNNASVMTMSVIGRKYYERDNYIYNPEYYSTHCDSEAKDVAIIRKKLFESSFTIFEHLHPNYTKGEMDQTYIRNAKYETYDESTYQRRKKANFHLEF